MANPVMKFLTIFGQIEGYGWTEVHYKQASSANPQLDVQLNNFILGVCAARQTLLGEDCFIQGARVSYPFAGRVRSNGKRQKLLGATGHPSSDQNTSLALELQNTTFDQSKIVHLRGFWDSVVNEASYQGDADGDWTARLIAYKTALFAGYGWLSKDPVLSASGKVLSYAVAPSGIVTFTVDPASVPVAGFPTGNFIVAFSKIHNSRSPLNRQLLVTAPTANTLMTILPIGCDPTTSTGHYNFRGTSFVGYSNSDSISVGERRMGRPLNRYPGRRRKQTLY